MSMTTRLGRVVIYHDRLSLIKSHDPLITWSTVFMATKLGSMVTSVERLLAIKSHDLLITWSFGIT